MKHQTGRCKSIQPEASDRYRYLAHCQYTPLALKAIFNAANTGETKDLCIAGREILEKNWDIQGALEQRAAGVLCVPWEVYPR